MRVIAGEFRSRRLISVEGTGTRPTPDRLREALFSILGAEVAGAVFVDAYAGSGAVGIEAISRGARQVIFLEKDRLALDAIRQNLAALRAEGRARIIAGTAAGFLADLRPDILFLDPPYSKESEYSAALQAVAVSPPGLVIVQHSVRFEPAGEYGLLVRGRVVRQGDNALTFYRPEVHVTAP